MCMNLMCKKATFFFLRKLNNFHEVYNGEKFWWNCVLYISKMIMTLINKKYVYNMAVLGFTKPKATSANTLNW